MEHPENSRSTISIREARPSDVRAIREIYAIPAVACFVSTRDEQEISHAIDGTASTYFLACGADQSVAGMALVRGLDDVNLSAEIRQLATCRQGLGVGGALLAWLLQHLFCVKHFNRVWLDVFPQNARARHLYTKLGFCEEGLLREAYLRDGNFQSAIVMSILRADYRPDSQGPWKE